MDQSRKSKDENPPNCYRVGQSWMVEFVFRGERFREAIGPVSRTVAKETAARRKMAAADGDLSVNGKRWRGTQWVTESSAPIEDPLFDVAMDRYLEFYKSENAAPTYRKYAKPASRNLKTFFDDYRLSQISLVLIEKYKRERKGAGRAEATINRELTLLRHLFNKCIDFQLASVNPFRIVTKLADGSYRVQKVNLFKEQGRERYLSQSEAQRLLNACNPELRIVVLVAMHTGFRTSELKSLRWGKVDLVNSSATVDSRYSKNGDTRTVPLSDDVAAVLDMLKKERNPNPDDHVFTRKGDAWKCWREAFAGAVARAGIKDFKFHDLRHCFASNLGMNNVNQKAMMELMGHKDPKMTLRYTHLSVEYKRQAVQNLPRFEVTDAPAESPEISPLKDDGKVVSFKK